MEYNEFLRAVWGSSRFSGITLNFTMSLTAIMNSLDRICHVMFRRSSFTYCKTSCLPQTKWTIFYFDLSIYFNSLLCKHQKQLHLYEKKKGNEKRRKEDRPFEFEKWKESKEMSRRESSWNIRRKYYDIPIVTFLPILTVLISNSFGIRLMALLWLLAFFRVLIVFYLLRIPLLYIYIWKKNLKCKYFEIVLGFH